MASLLILYSLASVNKRKFSFNLLIGLPTNKINYFLNEQINRVGQYVRE